MPESEMDDPAQAEADARQAVLAEAVKRFDRAKDADRLNREAALEDLEFALDSRQWDEEDRTARAAAKRPTVTSNRIMQFVRQVTGELRRNRPAIKVRPVGSEDASLATIREAIVQHIEYRSDATTQYALVAEQQVVCGIGYWRVNLIDAMGTDPMEGLQDLQIEAIADPLSVYCDPSAMRRDRTDARYWFILEDMPRDEFEAMWPDIAADWERDDLEHDEHEWIDRDEVRVAEYWRRGESGWEMWLLTSTHILAGPVSWPSQYAPFVAAIADEWRVGRRVVRKGMVRDIKDMQRLHNWTLSLLVEAMAQAPRSKWVVTDGAIEGREAEWASANTSSVPYLTYKRGEPAPEWRTPPQFPPGLVEAVAVFDEKMKATTGIYDASLGARSNETSGRAILARESQGDTATYHYADNFLSALRHLGRVLIDLIPIVYSAERTIRIVGDDKQERVIELNKQGIEPSQIINPVDEGAYDVVIDSGPAFASRRQEAAAGMIEMIRANPALAPVLTDLVAKMQDWPESDVVAQRLQAMLPPGLNGEQPPPDPAQEAAARGAAAKAALDEERARGQAIENDALLAQLRAVLGQAFGPQNFGPMPQAGMGAPPPPNGAPPPGLPGV